LGGALSWRGACRCVLSWAMVTINSYDLGVTANTLQDIPPWPGDNCTAHHTTLEGPQGSATGFPKQRSSQSGSFAGISSNLSWQRGLLARPPINQSNLLFRQQRRRVASPAGQRSFAFRCGAERNPVSFIDRSCCAILARAAGNAVFWPGLPSITNRPSFDDSSAARLRVLACRSESFSAFSAARIPCGAGRGPVSFIDWSCSAIVARAEGSTAHSAFNLLFRRQQRCGTSRARQSSTLQSFVLRCIVWRRAKHCHLHRQ